MLRCKMQISVQAETEILTFTFMVQLLRVFGKAFFCITDTGADG